MKKILLSALLLSCFFSFTTYNELPIGASIPRPDVKMKDISGKAVSLKESIGKNGLLVMFSCNTCPYVIRNQQRTKEICQYALDHGIGVVLINSNEAQRNEDDSFEAMKAYGKEQGYKWNYLVDEQSLLADAFDARRTPENFLFDKESKLVYHGATDDNPSDPGHVKRQHLKEAIDEMIAGKEVTVKTSRSVGCSIKRL
jgi:thioredoxin-related protein